MDALQVNYEEVTNLGAELVVFSSETNAISNDLAVKHGLAFPIVRDEKLNISRAYGLAFQLPDDLCEVYSGFGINIPQNTGDEAWELPMPARFVIDKQGIIRAVAVDPDYTRRPEPEETMALLRSIA